MYLDIEFLPIIFIFNILIISQMYKYLSYYNKYFFLKSKMLIIKKKNRNFSPGFNILISDNYLPNRPPKRPPRPPWFCCWFPPPPNTLPKRSVIGFPEDACASLVAFPIMPPNKSPRPPAPVLLACFVVRYIP